MILLNFENNNNSNQTSFLKCFKKCFKPKKGLKHARLI